MAESYTAYGRILSRSYTPSSLVEFQVSPRDEVLGRVPFKKPRRFNRPEKKNVMAVHSFLNSSSLVMETLGWVPRTIYTVARKRGLLLRCGPNTPTLKLRKALLWPKSSGFARHTSRVCLRFLLQVPVLQRQCRTNKPWVFATVCAHSHWPFCCLSPGQTRIWPKVLHRIWLNPIMVVHSLLNYSSVLEPEESKLIVLAVLCVSTNPQTAEVLHAYCRKRSWLCTRSWISFSLVG
jgi:hypothetical protein